ncbi:MAG: alpha/beta fold hydrolase [candidate division KSB1 bacterium]|nr:alpha/beta fold hydrolase [candidate division KSB1 bacterium]
MKLFSITVGLTAIGLVIGISQSEKISPLEPLKNQPSPGIFRFEIRYQGEVIGTESLGLRQEGETYVYTIQRLLPFNWFPEEIHATLKLNSRQEVTAYLKETYYQGIRDLAVLEQVDSVTWQYFASNEVQEVTFLENIELGRNFSPLDENYTSLYQCLLDKFHFGNEKSQTFYVFDGQGQRTVTARPYGSTVTFQISRDQEVQVKLDNSRRISRLDFPSGLSFVRVRQLPTLVSLPHTFADTSYLKKSVAFLSRDGTTLAGDLTLPRGNHPVPGLVLVSGTGPNSRHEGGILSAIAHQLGKNGIATLCYDKRGILESGGDYMSHTHFQLIDDAEGAYLYLRSLPEIDSTRIGLLGHSEGGLVVLAVAARRPQVNACFLMASPAVRIFPDLARIQTQAIGEAEGWSPATISRILTGITDTMTKLQLEPGNWWQYGQRLGYVGWLRSLLDSEPTQYLKNIRPGLPVIVFHGQQDVVVPPEQGQKIIDILDDNGHWPHEIVCFPELDHLFGKEIKLPYCLPYPEYVEVDPGFLQTLSVKVKQTFESLEPTLQIATAP